MRLFLSRSLERDESELDDERESESESSLSSLECEVDVESESESDSESDSDVDEGESEPPEVDRLDLRAFFLGSDVDAEEVVDSFSLALSFSLASRIRFAVPLFFVNSSGTSTDGFPSAFSLASSLGFSIICVLDGRDTYGRGDLHS